METLRKEELPERGKQMRYQQTKKTTWSEIISIIFYIYTHIHIFYITWFQIPTLIHLEGNPDNLLWQKCQYLLISRRKRLCASYFLMKFYTGYWKYFITVHENSTWTQTMNTFIGCVNVVSKQLEIRSWTAPMQLPCCEKQTYQP